MLILVALLMVAILVAAAMVIDYGVVRQNRQADKSASDMAVAAGIRSMDNGSGAVQSWKGICAARDFLLANTDELTGMTPDYEDGTGANISGDPCVTPPVATCRDPDAASPPYKQTWGVYKGTAASGRIQVEIRSGYELAAASGFAEDTTAYAGDNGDGPCDHLAIIIKEKESAKFGGAAGADEYETTIRSVARLKRDSEDEVAAALLLLERSACGVLSTAGNGATVRVEGVNGAAGNIHVDSNGSGSGCSTTATIFDVDGNTSAPKIIAGRGTLPDGTGVPGVISSVSMNGGPGAQPTFTAVAPAETCAQVQVTDCTATSPVTGAAPVGRALVGRGVVDARYRTHAIALRNDAISRFAWTVNDATANGFSNVGCAPTSPVTAARVWINCNGNAFNASNIQFSSTVTEVVINGYLNFTGSGTLRIDSPTKVFIRGRVGGNARGVDIGQNNTLAINHNGAATCEARYAQAPTARTQVVVGSGSFTQTAGELRMCQSTLFLLDTTGTPSCPIPISDGAAPYSNGCSGSITVNGGNVDWTAPNVNNVTFPTAAQLANFEDLALWSETETNQGIGGNGAISLSGIFFAPNANPFAIGGGGSMDVTDAQFITRKLRANGGGTLLMRPAFPNVIPIPALTGFTLVR